VWWPLVLVVKHRVVTFIRRIVVRVSLTTVEFVRLTLNGFGVSFLAFHRRGVPTERRFLVAGLAASRLARIVSESRPIAVSQVRLSLLNAN
jgi:hypothetical protein